MPDWGQVLTEIQGTQINNPLDVYKSLGLKVQPLPANYNPDIYGKLLMSGLRKTSLISYSTNTTSKISEEKQLQK